MESIEQISALKDEIKNHLLMIDHINAEKIALDQMYIVSLKELLNCKRDIILKDHIINSLNAIINSLNAKLESLTKEKDELQHTVNCMASEVQATE